MQDFAVYIIVAAAATYLVRGWFMTTKGEKGCGGCGACPSAKPQDEKLVQIDLGGSFKR